MTDLKGDVTIYLPMKNNRLKSFETGLWLIIASIIGRFVTLSHKEANLKSMHPDKFSKYCKEKYEKT